MCVGVGHGFGINRSEMKGIKHPPRADSTKDNSLISY